MANRNFVGTQPPKDKTLVKMQYVCNASIITNNEKLVNKNCNISEAALQSNC